MTRLTGLAVTIATSVWATSCVAQANEEPQNRPASVVSSTPKIAPTVRQEAEERGVPPALAEALVSVLSSDRADAMSSLGSVGLMQLHPAMARMHGYQGDTAGLLRPGVNLRYGMLHLAGAWALAKGDVCLALLKYRTSYAEEEITPSAAKECTALKARLAELGSPLASGRSHTATKGPPARPAVPTPQRPREAETPSSLPPARTETQDTVASVRTNQPSGEAHAHSPKEAGTQSGLTPRVSATRATRRASEAKGSSKPASQQRLPETAMARIIAGGRTTWQPVKQTRSSRSNSQVWTDRAKRLQQIEARITPNIIQIMRP